MRFLTLIEWKDGDITTNEFNTEMDAMVNLDHYWDHLTIKEQKKVVAAYVLDSNDSDEESEEHLDGTPVYVIK